jgi:hypothetical protein
MTLAVVARRIALGSALMAAIAACWFDPADPWQHPTWFMTMGILGTWAGGVISLMLLFSRPSASPPKAVNSAPRND